MKTDPILEEIWKFRDEYASRFDWNLDEIYRDLKKKEEESLELGSLENVLQSTEAESR